MRIPFAALCLVALAPRPASGATYVITADGSGDFATIQLAVQAAADGDVIELADGTYRGEGNRDIAYLGKAVTIRSRSGNPRMCVIDCDGTEEDPHRGFSFDGGEGAASVLEGVTIRDGVAPGGFPHAGGAISCSNRSSPSLANCVFAANSAESWGGALCCTDASPFVTACAFRGNSAAVGGGMMCRDSASPELTRCTFVENVAQSYGGGIFCESLSSPALTECVFSRNTAVFGAGLCCFERASPALSRCVISANEAQQMGGGAYCSGAGTSPSFASCTITGNTANRFGGAGLFCGGSATPTFVSCIIAFGVRGEAIYCQDGFPLLTCCDIHGNEGGDWTDGIENQIGLRRNFTADPAFCSRAPDADQNWALQDDSPCAPGNHPHQADCGLVGASAVGCGADPSTGSSWGRVKAAFRR